MAHRNWLTLLATFLLSGSTSNAEPGAIVPWVTYEAEAATPTGTVVPIDFTGQSPAREASGRSCVRLAKEGDHVDFIAAAAGQAIVVRYSLPDSAQGEGREGTLSVYLNRQFRQKLKLTSAYSWLYGAYPFTNRPSDGSPRNFWDECRLLSGEIHPGDVVRLQIDKGDSECLIDFLDIERVDPPIKRPAKALSVTDFGATPDDETDDRLAFITAIEKAKATRSPVWIPPGLFRIGGAIEVADVAIQGAGMWHTTLLGMENVPPENRIAIRGTGSNITLADFAVIGTLNYRNDDEPNDGIGGSFGTGSVIRNLWIEHTKAGAWVTNSDGLRVEGCRFRNTIADGMNLCLGMTNTLVIDCDARGTGDDCFAMWPATYAPATYAHGKNKFVRCRAATPFLAQGFAIYGGESNSVEQSTATDIPYGAGLFASTTFPTVSGFRGKTEFRNNRVVRAGGADGAIGLVANRLDLPRIEFRDIEVLDSATDAIKFISLNQSTITDALFERVHIRGSGRSGGGCGVNEAPESRGNATFFDVTDDGKEKSSWQDSPGFTTKQETSK